MPGHERGKLLMKLADLIETNADKLASIESLGDGELLTQSIGSSVSSEVNTNQASFTLERSLDIVGGAACLRYYAGCTDRH